MRSIDANWQGDDSYKQAIEHLGLISRTDGQGSIIYANEHFCKKTGYTQDELIGKNHRILNSGFHPKEFFTDLWKKISRGEVWRGVIKNIAKDGSFIWLDTTIVPVKNTDGKIIEYISFRYDVSEKKEIEELNHATQEIALVGGWRLNLKNNKLSWTEGTYRIHEIEIGSPLDIYKAISFYAEHERPKISALVRECIEKGISYSDTFEFYTAKGRKIWVHTKGEAEFDESRKIVSIKGTFQDVTAEKHLEEKLIESNQYLDLALEGAGLGIWDWYLETNAVKFDRRWAEMLGLDIETLPMQLSSWESRVHPDDLENCYADIKAYMDGKTDRYVNVHRMKHADGRWIYILDRGRFSGWDNNGKPVRFTGTHLDITETKRSYDVQIAELKRILASTPSCLKIVTKEGALVEMNPQGLMMIEADSFESGSKANIFDIIEKSHRDNYIAFHKRVCSGSSEHIIFEIIGLKGTRRWLESYAAPFKLPNGETALLGITNDITSKVENENNLKNQQMFAQHNAKLAAIGSLAAGVGHEINNPLTIIRGYLQTLQWDMKNSGNLSHERLADTLGRMMIAVDRIAQIVNGLRTFSRSDSRENILFSPVEALNEYLALALEIFQKDSVTISIQNNLPEKVFIRGNKTHYQQTLINLLNNARDAVENVDDKSITITFDKIGANVVIKVADKGQGIPAQVKDQIFDPFFTTKDAQRGTGLGLSLVQNFVREFDGTISVDSVVNKGSTFTIQVPIMNN